MLADHLLRLLPMIVSRCLIERGKECEPMVKICHLLLIWRKNKSLLVNVILVITYWHHEREKQRKWWTLFSWPSSSHRDSPSAICPLPSAQVTQAAFEDLRDIWRDTFDPGRYLLLGWYFWYMEITAALVMILLIWGRYLVWSETLLIWGRYQL